jgi:hypothetical protein
MANTTTTTTTSDKEFITLLSLQEQLLELEEEEATLLHELREEEIQAHNLTYGINTTTTTTTTTTADNPNTKPITLETEIAVTAHDEAKLGAQRYLTSIKELLRKREHTVDVYGKIRVRLIRRPSEETHILLAQSQQKIAATNQKNKLNTGVLLDIDDDGDDAVVVVVSPNINNHRGGGGGGRGNNNYNTTNKKVQLPQSTRILPLIVHLAIKSSSTPLNDILRRACKYFGLDPSMYVLVTLPTNFDTLYEEDDPDLRLQDDYFSSLPVLPGTMLCGEIFPFQVDVVIGLLHVETLHPFDPDLAIQTATEQQQQPQSNNDPTTNNNNLPPSTSAATNNNNNTNNPIQKSFFYDVEWISHHKSTWAPPIVQPQNKQRNLASMIRTRERRRALAGQSCLVIILAIFASLCAVLYSNVNVSRYRYQVFTRNLAWDINKYPTLIDYWKSNSDLIFSLATGRIVRIRQLRVNPTPNCFTTINSQTVPCRPPYSIDTASTLPFNTSLILNTGSGSSTKTYFFLPNTYHTSTQTTYLDRTSDSDRLIEQYYDGQGGYYLFMNRSYPASTNSYLPTELLLLNNFVDEFTRFIAIEFNSYDRNVGAVSAVKIIAQYPAWTSLMSDTAILSRTLTFNDISNPLSNTAIVLAAVAIVLSVIAILVQSGWLTCWPIRDTSVARSVEARFDGEVGMASLAAEVRSETNTGQADLDFSGGWAWMALYSCTAIFLIAGIAMHPRISTTVLLSTESQYVELYDDARQAFTTQVLFGVGAFCAILSSLHTLKLTWSGSLVVGTIMRCSYLLGPVLLSIVFPPGIAFILVAYIVFGPYSTVFGNTLSLTAYSVASWNFPYPIFNSNTDVMAWRMAFLILIIMWTYIIDASVMAVMLGAYLREYKLRIESRMEGQLSLFGIRDFIFGPFSWIKNKCTCFDLGFGTGSGSGDGDDNAMGEEGAGFVRTVILGRDGDVLM